MLTLQELKQVVGNRKEKRKVPSARYLRENDVAVVKHRLIDGAEIIAYQTGYVFYCAGDYGTVFPLFTCRDYVYEAGRKITVVKEDFFDNQPWYVRLILEGEDRLCRNREVREHNNCISYSHISEGWCELVDKRQNVLEKLIIEEAIGEFMDVLTDRQRQVIHQIYFQQRTQREVSRVFGITEPAVSKCISQATRVLIHEKSSLAPPGQSLAFSLGDEKGFEWIGAYDITADELLAGTDTAKTESKTAQAQMLILELLADGKRMPSAELEKAVNERGISSRTMRTAKSRIGDRLVTEKDGTAWVCYLRN